jgi:hypothetical protein
MPDLTDTLYPRRCPASGQSCLMCPEPTRLLVCLSAAAHDGLDELGLSLATALNPHVVTPTAVLNGAHFPLWHQPDEAEARLLLLATPDPDLPQLTWCAGGPVGLLDLDATAAQVQDDISTELANWQAVVEGTPPAHAWWHYLEAHRADPHRYSLTDAIAEFAAQPRIAVMSDVPRDRYSRDLYGPGLEALHAGPDAYADYLIGVLTFGGGLISLDGEVLEPSLSPLLVEQTLSERQDYHQRVRHYLQSLDPTVVLAAVDCVR